MPDGSWLPVPGRLPPTPFRDREAGFLMIWAIISGISTTVRRVET
jgi:hypothetical protein